MLLVLGVAGSLVGRLRMERSLATAAVCAVLQLALVSLVITAVLSHLVWSGVFALFMFSIAVHTSAGRIDARRAWPWVRGSDRGRGAAGAGGDLRVPGRPINGPSLVPMAGIIIGGGMTASSLSGRRAAGRRHTAAGGAAQIVVLVGLLATRTITVVVAHGLIRSARLLPADLRNQLIL